MTRFKKWLKEQGIKQEQDYEFLPCDGIECVSVDSGACLLSVYYVSAGWHYTQFLPDGIHSIEFWKHAQDDAFCVTECEKMGSNWVALAFPESWTPEYLYEEAFPNGSHNPNKITAWNKTGFCFGYYAPDTEEFFSYRQLSANLEKSGTYPCYINSEIEELVKEGFLVRI